MIPDLASLHRLDQKSAIVTGAGRGIGKAVATLLAACGARVILADIDATTAQTAAAEITVAGGEARAVAVDISDEASVQALIQATQAANGGIDALVHSAAIFPKYPLLDITVEQWDRIQSVNLRGTMLVMRETIRVMREQSRGGAIVNVSSVSGEREVVFHNAAYGASKAGTTNLTRVAALEFGRDGIRVNAVLPGGVTTEGARAATATMQTSGIELTGPMTQPERIPLRSMGEPIDIAAACAFLISPAARYITGQALAVDGGFLVS